LLCFTFKKGVRVEQRSSEKDEEIIPNGEKVVSDNLSTMPNNQGGDSGKPVDTASAQHTAATAILRDMSGETSRWQSTPSHLLSIPVPSKRPESKFLRPDLVQPSYGSNISCQHQPSRLRRWDLGLHSQGGQTNHTPRNSSSSNARKW